MRMLFFKIYNHYSGLEIPFTIHSSEIKFDIWTARLKNNFHRSNWYNSSA